MIQSCNAKTLETFLSHFQWSGSADQSWFVLALALVAKGSWATKSWVLVLKFSFNCYIKAYKHRNQLERTFNQVKPKGQTLRPSKLSWEENLKLTWRCRWRRRLHRSCWPKARLSPLGRPPWWWCGRWRQWRRGHYRSHRSPKPSPSQFHSATARLEGNTNKHIHVSDGSSFFVLQCPKVNYSNFWSHDRPPFRTTAGEWGQHSNMWHTIKTQIGHMVAYCTWRAVRCETNTELICAPVSP